MRIFYLTVNVMDRIMSTSIVLLDQNFNATNDNGIWTFCLSYTPPPPAAVFGRAIDDNEKATRCDLSNPNEIATRCDLSNSNEIATRCDLSNPNEIATRCDFNANDVGKMVFEPCVLSPPRCSLVGIDDMVLLVNIVETMKFLSMLQQSYPQFMKIKNMNQIVNLNFIFEKFSYSNSSKKTSSRKVSGFRYPLRVVIICLNRTNVVH